MDLYYFFGLCGQAINACFAWLEEFSSVIPAFGGGIISVFTIYTAYRLLLAPLIGYAGSDLADHTLVGAFKQKQADRAYARNEKAKGNYSKHQQYKMKFK